MHRLRVQAVTKPTGGSLPLTGTGGHRGASTIPDLFSLSTHTALQEFLAGRRVEKGGLEAPCPRYKTKCHQWNWGGHNNRPSSKSKTKYQDCRGTGGPLQPQTSSPCLPILHCRKS